jgi:hypothetical protein
VKRKLDPILKWGCLVPLTLVVALVCGLLLADRFIPSAARRALPGTATEIQEYFHEHGITGDATRLLRAKLPADEYPRYAERLGLRVHFDPKRDADIASILDSLRGIARQSWFTPPPADATTYLDRKSGIQFFTVLWYSDGYVYYAGIAS